MAHCAQALKRFRQSEKRRIRNKSVKNEIKTLTKRLREKVAAKDTAGAQELARTIQSKLDKAAKRHIFHKNTAARGKSKIQTLAGAVAS